MQNDPPNQASPTPTRRWLAATIWIAAALLCFAQGHQLVKSDASAVLIPYVIETVIASAMSRRYRTVVVGVSGMALCTGIGAGISEDLSDMKIAVGVFFAIAVEVVLLVLSTITFAIATYARGQEKSESRTCHTCGYDLRGLAHDRCPECGAAVDLTSLEQERG